MCKYSKINLNTFALSNCQLSVHQRAAMLLLTVNCIYCVCCIVTFQPLMVAFW